MRRTITTMEPRWNTLHYDSSLTLVYDAVSLDDVKTIESVSDDAILHALVNEVLSP